MTAPHASTTTRLPTFDLVVQLLKSGVTRQRLRILFALPSEPASTLGSERASQPENRVRRPKGDLAVKTLASFLSLGIAYAGCAGGHDSSPAELALATAAPEEYAAWRAAGMAMEAAREEAGLAAIEKQETTLATAQAHVENAREAWNARVELVEAELAAELEWVNSREVAEKQEERPIAEAAMDRAYSAEEAELERLIAAYNTARRAGRWISGRGHFTPEGEKAFEQASDAVTIQQSNMLDWKDKMTEAEKARRWPNQYSFGSGSSSSPHRWESSDTGINSLSPDRLVQAQREAWGAFHAIGSRAEAARRAARQKANAAKAEAEQAFKEALAQQQEIYDKTETPKVVAFYAAQKSEGAARERLAQAAPEAWAAFVATLDAAR